MQDSTTISLAKTLIAKPSVTPHDSGCQQLIAQHLQQLGFHIEHLRFADVDNLWARLGTTAPLLVFAGHTDVVPTGPESQWTSPPFVPVIRDQQLFGRGAADMKGSIAAMITATQRFIAANKKFKGSIGFLITSDEEGPSINGTVKVVETLQQRQEKIDWCLIGEPSSQHKVADTIKNGRRGSISGHLIVHGTQGHVAYPHLALNPIHAFAPALSVLTAEIWDTGNEHFPPTTFQISNIHAGTGATNVIPGDLEVHFNFRFSTAVTDQQLRDRVEHILKQHQLRYTLNWNLSGQAFLTAVGELVAAASASIQEICHYPTTLSTSGGTSDGRFIAPTGAQVVELGPINASIHKIDEHVGVDELNTLSAIYERILQKLLR